MILIGSLSEYFIRLLWNFLINAICKMFADFFKIPFKTEGVGFEPTIPCGIPALQAGALDHYANPPF